MGLQAGNLTTRPAQNYDVGLSYEGNTTNQLVVSDLTYRQMLGKNFAVVVGAEGLNAVNVFRGANRVESAGSGPISALAQRLEFRFNCCNSSSVSHSANFFSNGSLGVFTVGFTSCQEFVEALVDRAVARCDRASSSLTCSS